MKLIAQILIALIAIEHIYILWIEMFAWTTQGKATFKSLPAELFEPTKALAANQGLYNGFLAAGLIWGLVSGQFSIKLFFLVCVIIAGIFGAFTARRSILYIQAMPALLGLILLYLSR